MINVSSSHKPKEYFGTVGGGQFLFKHGKGILVYQNGDTYDGEFVFNVRHGKGKLNLVNKTEEYEGQFQRNRKNGYGVLRYLHTNQYYKGNFVDDVREGEGVMRFSNGDEYLGNFKHNSIEGFGTMKYKNGDIYEGEWKEGIRNGLGTYSLKKNKLGMTMKGFFVNGLVHGEGSLEVPGISVFVGDFRRGERTSGTIYFLSDAGDPRVDFDLQSSTPSPPPENKNDEKDAEKDATTGPLPRVRRCYQGEWDGDNMEGKGLLWYSDDSFYCGYFRRNQRQGPGNLREIHRYPDTTTPYYITEYSGFFYKDKKQGWGIERDQHMERTTRGAPIATSLTP
ncbi:phosphatidylinositol-4-phosphate 5-kinase [Angomonas deanei]|uniref:MORN repeat, putative n=1 Tax=Angomonas deanei TaxID=59799 RepID=A0A7G2C8J6_9TRYP|nr:phosphatidylinositol-4-phosphate 5-kinase [Angomonas deanei]CAD2215073.1 MORN repeat, putative [Angomonas deanei]|eukprot:EPY23956.1 phosphatidylinositol-4-phosphate 5-kinase [Angomonas deanei]